MNPEATFGVPERFHGVLLGVQVFKLLFDKLCRLASFQGLSSSCLEVCIGVSQSLSASSLAFRASMRGSAMGD